MSDRERIRCWRQRIYTRIQFAIGLILLTYAWLSLLPALWASDVSRNVAAGLTAWFVFAQVVAVRGLWRWLSSYWRAAAMKREEE